MNDTQRGICPECGTEQLVNKDQTIRKHGDCPGAGQPPAADNSTPPAEETTPDGGPLVATDPQDDSGTLAEQRTGDRTTPLEGHKTAGEDSAEDRGGDGTYRWEITVAQPAIYLDDPAWHAANSLLAAQHATDAGHVPTGEAPCTNVAATEDGGGLTLTYHVPIET